MKKPIKSILLALGLVCASFGYGAQLNINAQAAAQLPWQDIGLSQQTDTTLSENQQPIATIHSPIAAYRLPANQGTLNITISSFAIDNKALFVPTVAVLDANYNLAATYPSSVFKFHHESGLQGNRLSTELNLTPTPNQDYIYLLVYTTAEDLQGSTLIPHPAKLYAKARGNQPPAIDDLQAKHSRNGKIQISVDGKQSAQFIGMQMPSFKDKSTTSQPIGNTAKAAAGAALTKPVEKETENYFNTAIRNALKQNDIDRAMNLVNEAEKLGLSSPRKTFINNVSKK
ncbi:maltose operon protein [Pasteurella testudinis DSM 23072]|uniref:Maltose operon protein n=1 Tax=Pasteurella testudinis DSM 23072 TaxID=1122938 RepID=A0A1W1UGY0_9PAST|nr:maltose operon protein MalM [Pasteurella testudinis]SMB80282.1 maltose operon protein [Pasteurella testudinis DSM 23072]SUB50558.1 maltose regulon periplasmic protein [Pasteurella testudinis]